MNVIEKANIIYFHKQCIQYEADNARKLGWINDDAQQERFKTLCHVSDISNSAVMDLGCGLGDMKIHLDSMFKNIVYLGIDLVSEFVDSASQRFNGCADTFFKQADFTTDGLPEVDYVLASGALSYQTDNMLFPYRMIEKMFHSARKAVAFNMLDEEKFVSDNWLRSYNKNEVLEYCQGLSKHSKLVTGYLPDDFTIFMYK